ncbi:hypothetical protein DYB35_009927 [Aphanomyces astaci]|uniref:DDE-1 domain-containing protein n=1 Tax=Aphanomyces astaci TaxID=112090 RepID=A0A418CP02_APHAT|nr:hypothetical protein DYB35_009927 [Aphanomyces astaci]
MPPLRKQHAYTIDRKREYFVLFDAFGGTARTFCALHGLPQETWKSWTKQRANIMSTRRNAKRKTLGGQGAKSIIPFERDLLTFMKDVRRDEHILTSMHMINFTKTHYQEWLTGYMANKVDPYKSLLGLCQSFAHRHRFSQRVPCHTKLPNAEMVQIRNDFAATFWGKYAVYELGDLINVDETAVYYDMPPGKIWAEVGGSSKTDKTQKHSDRITAVLSCRADGTNDILHGLIPVIGGKLPIFFIVHGTPGGTIDSSELCTYPEGHHYAVQESGWMDGRVWRKYLKMLPPHILGPSVILADNFDAHVSKESAVAIAEYLHSVLEPLPANCTSVCQPLDVGVMGPFKKILRMLWLEEAPVVSASEKRMAMIKRSIKAWGMISEVAVKRSFEKAIPRPEIVVV